MYVETPAFLFPASEQLASEQTCQGAAQLMGKNRGPSILQPIAFGIDEHLEPGRHASTQLQWRWPWPLAEVLLPLLLAAAATATAAAAAASAACCCR